MGYNGTIELIAGVKPANNGNFPMVNAKDVYVDDDTRLDAKLNGLDDSIDDLNAAVVTDATLSQTGKPADAKAVGDAINNITIEVDATLSQTGKAADAKATGDAVGDLKTQLNNSIGIPEENITNISGYELHQGFITSTQIWGNINNKYQHIIIPIERAGGLLKIVAGSVQPYYAFLTAYETPIAGASPSFCESPYNVRKYINAGGTLEITIPNDAKYLYFAVTINEANAYPASFNMTIPGTQGSLTEQINELDDAVSELADDVDVSETAVATRWFTGTIVGNTISETTASGAKSSVFDVETGEGYIVTCKGGASGRAYYLLDSEDKIVDLAGSSKTLTNYTINIPDGVVKLIVQTNASGTWNVMKSGKINNIENEISEIKSRIELPVCKTSKTKFGNSALAKLKMNNTGFVNIGFIGDSWTQGVPDNASHTVDPEKSDYETYVKWLSKKLWETYGFGGLGWLDFSLDGGHVSETARNMFGCSDMFEHWGYEFSGTITGKDGSSVDDASACLGICCAHTIFGNNASITLTFDEHYLDKFKIAYYQNAHFTVSVNGGTAQEITANSTDGWQTTEIGITGTDITSVVITSLADGCVIFGMDCFYGTNGVRCHKIGNRSMKLSNYLMMDEQQFEDGIASLNLRWVSLLFAINDIGSSTSDSACKIIIARFADFIGRIKTACTRSGLMSCDISMLGCANISNSGYTGLPKLEEYEHEYALENGYGWVSTRQCIGADKDELAETGLFSDGIHLNQIGSKIYGEYIFRWLFDSISA